LVIVGEVYITKPVFERLRETLRDSTGNPYKNARNMAAGSIRCHDAKACAGRGLTFSPFGVIKGLDEHINKSSTLAVLQRFGFSTCSFLLLIPNPSEKQVVNSINDLRKTAEDMGFPIDGIVITYDNIPYSLSRGRTGHHYYS
jgi:DNA ligase (NAD+)